LALPTAETYYAGTTIQHHRVMLNHGTPLSGVSSLTPDQLQVLKALKVQRRTEDRQLSLL
jgi:hypothetical protein